jgi:dihydropteroate synthase
MPIALLLVASAQAVRVCCARCFRRDVPHRFLVAPRSLGRKSCLRRRTRLLPRAAGTGATAQRLRADLTWDTEILPRKIYYWKLAQSELQLGERTLIMGVLNVTPDSFSDGGQYNEPDRAYARALELEEEGADIIDLGAESTRPGSHRISADEEWQRLVPVLKRLRGNLRTPLSLDTYKSEIAERALQYGVEIFNDPSGLTFDPNLAKVAANGNAGLILNHMRGQPETWVKLPPMQDAAGTIARDLDATISRARRAGVDRARIVIDPGLGFGKRKEQNAEILADLRRLTALDYPILVGPSRKHFLAQASENNTLFATAAAVTAAILNGAHLVRVHDVKEMQSVVHVADEIAAMAGAAARFAQAAEERQAARARSRAAGGTVEPERPRPPRPPVSWPAQKRSEGARRREEASTEPEAQRPPFRKPDRGEPGRYEAHPQKDGSRPPRRPGPPGQRPAREFGPQGFRPTGSKRSFDRGGDRPGSKKSGPPKRPFRKRP